MSDKITDLTKLEIGESVNAIAGNCFVYTTKLKDITIPASVTTIPAKTLAYAASLSSITFGDQTAAQVYAKWQNVADIGIMRKGLAKDKDGNPIDPLAFSATMADGVENEIVYDSTGMSKAIFIDNNINYKDIESIDMEGAKIPVADDSFLDCDKLVEVVADGYTAQEVAESVESWSLGIASDGTTHLVVVYCSDGVVVINDADSSSGELAPSINWEKFSEMLEDYPNMVAMPAVGSSLNVKYKVDVDADFVDTEWQILGYNKSIPEYVKYKNGSERIFVRSVEEDQNSANYQLLKSDFVNSPIYSRSDDGTYAVITGKTVASVGSESFTYGNNCTYSVPMSIVVDGTTYSFAGYNVTLAPKYLLAVKNNGDVLYHQQFDSGRNSYGQNDWSTSMSRAWFNDSWSNIQNRCANQQWNDEAWSNTQTTAIKGMVDRVESGSKSFFAHVMPTVNRTWTFKYNGASDGSQYDLRYRKDSSGTNITSSSSGYDVTKAGPTGLKYLDGNVCEHCVDKFWLLGIGNINCSGSNTTQYFKDGQYDTSKYDEIFNETDVYSGGEPTKVKLLMKEDGKKMAVARYWRLRSAYSDTANYNRSKSVGYVDDSGNVSHGDASGTSYGALLPSCTIC